MMYQLPIDMISMMIRLNLAIQPPSRHRAARPYGFSIVSLATGAPTFAGGTASGAGAGAAASDAAGAAAVSAAGADACAWAASGMAATVARARSAAANGVRIDFRKD